MARNEGVLSLMKGFSPSMLRELVYSGFRLGTYEFFKDQCVLQYFPYHGNIYLAPGGTLSPTELSRGKASPSKYCPQCARHP